MATLGRPAVNDPREFTLREVQQVVANIRERLRVLDLTVSTVQSTQTNGSSTVSADLTALQRQITNLAAVVAALQVQVDGLDLGGSETDPRVEQLAGELMGIRRDLDDEPLAPRVEQLAGELQGLQQEVAGLGDPDPGRLPAVEAHVAQLKRQVDDIDPTGQNPVHAALLQRLQSQINDLQRSVLL